MLKYVYNKIIRFVFLIFYLKRGTTLSYFKSVTSPKELSLQKSKIMQSRVEEFRKLIIPIILNQGQLKRYGSIADGGYVLPLKAVRKSKFLISGGIESNNQFEISLAQMGIKGVQIDNSIDIPPELHKNLSFIRATLGNKKEVNIDQLIKQFPKSQNGILKLDIEGGEYAVLSTLSNLKRFNLITVEFHFLYRISENQFWKNFQLILINLQKNHNVVYISPNNCCGYTILGGFPVPNVMEITWANKALITGRKFRNINSLHPKNMTPNYPMNSQLDISTFFPNLTL